MRLGTIFFFYTLAVSRGTVKVELFPATKTQQFIIIHNNEQTCSFFRSDASADGKIDRNNRSSAGGK